MIFCFIIFNIFSISVGWDYLYATGLDFGQKIDFKSVSEGFWVLLNSPRIEIAGFPSSDNRIKSIYRIGILKRAKNR